MALTAQSDYHFVKLQTRLECSYFMFLSDCRLYI